MKLAVALAALTLSAPALAQQQQAPRQQRPTLGLGIAIDPVHPVAETIELYLPINLAPLRIEPSLGILTSDAPGNDTSDVTLGLGVLFVSRLADQVDLHLGGRVKLGFASTDNGAVDDSGISVALAAAAGGEYYLVPRFSLGLEGQLGFYSDTDVRGDDSGVFTAGLAFLRLYFN